MLIDVQLAVGSGRVPFPLGPILFSTGHQEDEYGRCETDSVAAIKVNGFRYMPLTGKLTTM